RTGFVQANFDISLRTLAGVDAMQQFLADVAHVALEGTHTTSLRPDSIRALTPLHARSFLESVVRRTFEEARFIVGNLQSLIAKPAEVTRVNRAASLAFVPGVALVIAALAVSVINFEHRRWDRGWAAAYPGSPSLRI